MKIILTLAFGLACALSLDAQITATLNRLSDGSSEITVRNHSAISLSAFVISTNVIGMDRAEQSTASPRAPFVVYYDPAIDPETEPLLPHQERVLPRVPLLCPQVVGNLRNALRKESKKENFCELEQPIAAGILADGSTTGDAALLARLMLRRRSLLAAVETALEMISDAGRRNVPRDQLIRQFRTMADSLNRWYLPAEQRVGFRLYQSIIGKLMNLPEGQIGSPFPPSTFVAQETAALNRQRVILMESRPSLAVAL